MVALLNTRDSPIKEKLGEAMDKLLHKAADTVTRIQTQTISP